MAQPSDKEPSSTLRGRQLSAPPKGPAGQGATGPAVVEPGPQADQAPGRAGSRSQSMRTGSPDPLGAPFLGRPGAPPVTRGDGGSWILFALLGFAGGEVVAFVFVMIAAALSGQSTHLSQIESMATPPEWYVGVSLVGLWAGFGGGPWIASKVRGSGRLVADLGIRFRPIDALGVLIGVGSQYLIDLVYAPFIRNSTKFGAPTQKLTGAAHGWGFLVIAVLTVVGAPFFEELFFRGLLLRGLVRVCALSGTGARRILGVIVAVILDGMLFGLAHGEWEQFAGLAAFGVVLAVVSYRTGRLGMNMVSHSSFNLVAVLAVLGSRGALVH